jgi:hypothetical protein
VSVTVGDNHMISAGGKVSATRQHDGDRCPWLLSWAPELPVDRNQAITGLLLADHVLSVIDGRPFEFTLNEKWGHGCDGCCPMWPFIVSWAGELELTGEAACTMVEESVRRS